MRYVLFIVVFCMASSVMGQEFSGGWLPRVQGVRKSTRIVQESTCAGGVCGVRKTVRSVLANPGYVVRDVRSVPREVRSVLVNPEYVVREVQMNPIPVYDYCEVREVRSVLVNPVVRVIRVLQTPYQCECR